MALTGKDRARLSDLEDAYIECRTRRHRFESIPDPGGSGRKYQESSRVARLAERCDRCGLVREEAWNRTTGAILFVNYKYPDGYSLGGTGSKPWDVRKEFLARLDADQTSLVRRVASRRAPAARTSGNRRKR
jgi:hypothetical protein